MILVSVVRSSGRELMPAPIGGAIEKEAFHHAARPGCFTLVNNWAIVLVNLNSHVIYSPSPNQ